MAGGWRIRGLLYAAVAALAAVNAGCLVVAAGAAAGGAAGYAYYKGLVYRDYPASLADATAAVRTSLTELQMAPTEQTAGTQTTSFESKAADGSKVRVWLETVNSPIPADGSVTRISVRVGTFGDSQISARVLDQVGSHLVHPSAAHPGAPQHAPAQHGAALQPIQQAQWRQPAETGPPPLADPGPAAAAKKP